MQNKTPNYDSKVKKILDELKPGEKVCALTGKKWDMTEEEISWYKKFNVPPHNWEPVTRLKYLMGFPSGIAIWKKPHAKTPLRQGSEGQAGEEILSFIHPDSPFKVITDREWFSEEYAQSERELDSDKPFFEQFKDLSLSIPYGALRDDGSNVNTAGVDIIDAQDSYMLFGGYDNKRVAYGAISYMNEDCNLVTNIKKGTDSFMINASLGQHKGRCCIQNGPNMNCTFTFACNNLENCYGACNHSYKKYLFWNLQLSQGEWEKEVSKIDLKSQKVFDEEWEKFYKMITKDAFWPPRFEKKPNEDCTGDYFIDCVRCHDCYWTDYSVDSYRCWVAAEAIESAFSLWIGWGHKAYMSVDLATYNNLKFCFRTWRCQSLEYSMDCYDCENCFGCVGLRKKKFHIFNKSYSEDEYWNRVDEIKCSMLERGEYGQFFPAELSQPGYQFSMGEFFLGYSDEELELFKAPKYDPTVGNVETSGDVIRASELPLHLDEADPKRHIGKPILDEKLGRMFTITPKEFAFYKRHGLPLPREHFLTRMTKLIRHSNVPIPEEVKCLHCGVEFEAYYNAVFSGRRKMLCRECHMAYLETR